MASLLPTRFFIPPVPAGFIARPQLLEKIDGVLSHRLTLVSAPAGAGKTTQVSAWVKLARKKGVAFGWLALDEADNDPGHFQKYLVACLEEGGVAIDGGTLPQEAEQTEPLNMMQFLDVLISESTRLTRELILILDDYQNIQNTDIHAALAYLIEYAPPQLHIIILTRSDPPLELARLRVDDQLLEIRMEQLRFSTQEATFFLEKSAGIQLTEGDAEILNARTEGWIAGLQMAAISLRGRGDVGPFVTAFAGSHRFVFDYLLEQVLNRQTMDVREFLLKTSVLEKLSASLCEAITDIEGSGRNYLDLLDRSNLFLIPLDDERGWYRYHHLFSDLLRLMLDQTHPGLSSELHRKACNWYETQMMLPEALHHAISSGDMQLVAHIVSANVLVLLENDEAIPALHKIDSLPMDELAAAPWLGIAHSWVLGTGQVNKSLQILNAAEKNAQNTADDVIRQKLKGHIAVARAALYSLQGDKTNTITNAREANDLLPEEEIAARALNLSIWGDVLSSDGHDPGAMPILEQSLELALRAEKPHVAMIATAALASAHLGAGRLHEMYRVCQEALVIADNYERQYQRPLSASAGVYPLLARVLAEWGENEKAIQFARKGLMLSERWGQSDNDVACLDYLGRALTFGNDWVQARQVFQRANNAARNISPWFWQMNVNFTLESMLDLDTLDAREFAEQIRRVQESGSQYSDLLKARLFLRQNQPENALEVLEEALTRLAGQPSFDIVRIHALRSLALRMMGDEKQSLVSIRQALELAEPENRIATFVREGLQMEKLLQLARLRSITPKFVNRLLAAFESRRLLTPKLAPGPETLIEPLSERELEILTYLNGPFSTPEIAGQLIVSANTVRTHIKNIYNKLGVHGRSGAVKQARELGLIN